MSNDISIKSVTALAKSMGITVERIERGPHTKFYLDTPVGKKMMVVSISASDHRAFFNVRGLLRKWSRNENQQNT